MPPRTLSLLPLLLLAAGAVNAAPPPIAWGPCDDELAAAFPGLGPRLQCARLAVPLDHHAPSSGTLALEVLRVRAADPAQRRGNLFINPGGPGVPAFFYAASLVANWEGDFLPSPDKRRISERHDVIAVQPRGLQGSTLRCRSDALLYPYEDITDDRSEANLVAINRHAATVAQGCQAQPLAAYINTEQTARDLEAVRQRLGGEPLNYWGVSWGTELGAWYGALFPHQVDRMILDSNVDWTRDLYVSWAAQGPARQEIFDRFVVDHVIRSPQVYGLGTRPQDVQARFAGFSPASRQIVRALFDQPETLLAVDFLDRTLKADPSLSEAALRAHAQAHRYSPDDAVDAAAREQARIVIGSYFAPAREPAPLDLDPGTSVFTVVSCQSSMNMPPPAFWDDLGDDAARAYPVGGSHNAYEACAYWTGPTRVRPDMRRLSAIPGLVMLQAEYDWRTPRAGAFNARRVVPDASLVIARGLQGHGLAYNGASACVDGVAGRFLADGLRPPRQLDCHDSAGPRRVPSYLETLQDALHQRRDQPGRVAPPMPR